MPKKNKREAAMRAKILNTAIEKNENRRVIGILLPDNTIVNINILIPECEEIGLVVQFPDKTFQTYRYTPKVTPGFCVNITR